jgi:hypothetical protein
MKPRPYTFQELTRDTPPSPGSITYHDPTFKFSIGQKVHNTLNGANCIVYRQLVVTTVNGTFVRYDLFKGDNMYDETPEEWIEEGHRVE